MKKSSNARMDRNAKSIDSISVTVTDHFKSVTTI